MKTHKKDRRVRFILGWQFYKPGDVIEPNGVLRDWLLGRGYVEEYSENANAVETATVAAPEVEATRIVPPKRKRGRPPKVRTE